MRQYKNQYEAWSEYEINFIKENYQKMGSKWCKSNMGTVRSSGSIEYQANHNLKIKRLPAWSQENLDILVKNYHLLSARELAKMTGKTENAIRQKAAELKINCINYLEWTEEDLKTLHNNYSKLTKGEILKLFPNREWLDILKKANTNGLKKQSRSMEKILGDVKPLLNKESALSGYWLGFLLADGHFSKTNRIVLCLADLDSDHVFKFGSFINFSGKIKKEKCKTAISIMDSFNVKNIKETYDIKNDKTYSPPNLKIFENLSDDFLLSLIIGFIDGDGCVHDRKNKQSKFITVKCHSSWLNILNYFISRISIFSGVKIPDGIINNQGYARIFITNNVHLKFLKKKTIEFKLPVLNRK